MNAVKPNAKYVLLCCFYLLQGCSGGDSQGEQKVLGSAGNGQTTLLNSFASDDAMLQQLRSAARAESTSNGQLSLLEGAEQVASDDSVGGSGFQPVSSSGTNVQVQGVDEADLIKVSGDQLFALYTPELSYQVSTDSLFYDPNGQQKPAELQQYQLIKPAQKRQSVTLPSEIRWSGLYALPASEQLLLQGEGVSASLRPSQTSFWWGGSAVTLRAISTAPGTDMSQAEWQVSIDGRLVGSRLIDNTLYVVTEYGAPYVHPYADQTGNIDELTLDEWLPHWQLNGEDKGALVASGNCYASAVDERRGSTRVTTLLALPLDNPEAFRTRCLLGTAETLFVSQDALYVATTETYYQPWAGDVIDVFFPDTTNTDVHKFGFDDELSYRGGVSLQGHLGWHPQQRSYRLGATDGVLSVVTSGSNSWLSEDQQHRLYTLAEKGGELAVLAHLPNSNNPQSIGKPGERIHGTRVVGDRVYVVTFLTTDPLYIVNVSNPESPFIAGEVEVPGFSDYLHPVGESLLLGIGKSASGNGTGDDGRGGWYQGLRLSLFDVADASNPSLINALEYGDRGSSSDLFQDFHALAWMPTSADSAQLALPIDLYQHSKAPSSPWQQGEFVHRGLYSFAVDDTGLREISTALVGSPQGFTRNGRVVLSSSGDAWFFDDGELYYADAESPSLLLPSQ